MPCEAQVLGKRRGRCAGQLPCLGAIVQHPVWVLPPAHAEEAELSRQPLTAQPLDPTQPQMALRLLRPPKVGWGSTNGDPWRRLLPSSIGGGMGKRFAAA